MSAYVIFVVDEENDAEVMKTYRQSSRASLDGRDVKVITLPSCNKEVLEGEDVACIVILEFPDMEQARDWYHSEEYQKWAPMRKGVSKGSAFIVDGFVPMDTAHWASARI
ncbi:MAG: DUF1330 domain-containing protein [Porticoccaceae bacterium]